MTGRRRALALVAASIMAGILAIASHDDQPRLVALLGVVVGASFVGAGLVALSRSKRNRIGLLMVGIGLAWIPQQLAGNFEPPLQWIVIGFSSLWVGGLAHLALAFPTGRLGGLLPRLLVTLAYLETTLVSVSIALEMAGDFAPPTALAFLIDGIRRTQAVVAVVIGAAVLSVVVMRWRRSSVTQRRATTPVYAAAALVTVLFVSLKPVEDLGLNPTPVYVATLAALAATPLAYLASLVRRRIDQAGVADLVVGLSTTVPTADLQAALATTLHDPTLRVGYWLPEHEHYADSQGEPLALPPPGAERVVTRVDRAGARVAVLIHDPALLDEPELVDAACAAAALALENERLTAALRARLRQLAESRARLVQAGEAERRRLERDLHDGVQQRLLSAAMTLGLAETTLATDQDRARPLVGEAKEAVLHALDDLRALCQGIHPPVLTERGLRGAVQELTSVAAVPLDVRLDLPDTLPPEIESSAYYIVAEALTNLTKHANAARGWIRVAQRGGDLEVEVGDDGCGGADPTQGTGLAGLVHRVEATAGTLAISSSPGQGTTVKAVLPCGS
ncbi:sensor histidine kinase [Actinopolymorpha alba]|uniref:sensor histidine kinase n=1 Tax=Actinopolymorpha alba TaxID=533267 RepID=UPI000367293E|nr:sensor histidine kinase [Actinopolymorpha alba]